MDTETFTYNLLSAIEVELQRAVSTINNAGMEELHHMLAYHMGWEGEGAGPEATGKRIRPVVLLLCSGAAGTEWQVALPAAAAVELVHNFSLIHDDIEDHSHLRRGRPTLWKRWGVPLALNAGDSMFTLAHLTLFRLQETTSLETAFRAAVILQETCLQLTQGQHLDISYEERDRLDLQAYWAMVGGKTAALLAACTELGALIARVDPNIQAAYREFGLSLGLAFQAQDDLLGIWGDSEMLGKSTASDLYSGKKSLPVLYGLSYGGAFARRWRQGPIKIEEVSQMAQLLEQEGAKGDTQEQVLMYTNKALSALEQACPLGQAGDALISLTNKLLIRRT